jgi:hypothetical protein
MHSTHDGRVGDRKVRSIYMMLYYDVVSSYHRRACSGAAAATLGPVSTVRIGRSSHCHHPRAAASLSIFSHSLTQSLTSLFIGVSISVYSATPCLHVDSARIVLETCAAQGPGAHPPAESGQPHVRAPPPAPTAACGPA